jgi:hypothetical protein
MLEDILKERYVPEMPSNLAYRIIEAAKPRGEEKGLTWAGVSRAFGELFIIPQPAYAMAVMLIVGVYTGVQFTNQQNMSMTVAQANLSSFVTAELSVDYGEFQ